jgi:hypothetical protein
MSYFNTTHLEGSQLDMEIVNAKSQVEAIKMIFRKSNHAMSPSEVQRAYKMMTHKRISINSVRRAMSDLTRQRFLSKLNKLKEGPWGKPEHYWELNLNQAL